MSPSSSNLGCTSVVPYRLRKGTATLYDPSLCDEIIHYFTNAVASKMVVSEESFEKEFPGMMAEGPNFKGKHKAIARAVIGDIPTFERFANSLGVTTRTLYNWSAKFPDFAYAMERCNEIQKDIFVQGLASGRIPANGGIFVAKNVTGMRDEQTVSVQQAPVSTERPALAKYTPAQLQELRELVEKSKALGIQVELTELKEAEDGVFEAGEK